ncbi:hypothetical protein SADO_13078 [Salinisphaera dokdonensis CL-ES53]|uniref:Uncharacterized protein n=1 Tax=Salinisphaera dokdonensis CL-ES53 TaxID=1304272 RepID=A0ABV2B442_9GAMM
MKYSLPLLVASLALPGAAMAASTPSHNYPTQARVEYVFDCMNQLGGESYDTLYKCSCSIDYIADQLPYDDFITLDTYQRGQNAAGERPEVLREGSIARDSRSQLASLKAEAADQCLIDTSKIGSNRNAGN